MNHVDQARFMWKWANQRGNEGVHSFELRERKILNPSQRSKDIADHVPFWTTRDGRGSRYFTDGNQPTGANRVVPNNGAEVGGGRVPGSGRPDEAATVVKSSADLSTEPLAWVRDYDGSWSRQPLSEAMAA